MALSQNSQIDWTDIQNVYEKLNTQRKKFGFTVTTIGDNAGVRASTVDVTNLKDAIQEMTSHSQLTAIADTSGVTVPKVGELFKISPYERMNEIITRISGTSTNGSNYGYCGSYFSSYCTSDTCRTHGYCSSFYEHSSYYSSGYTSNNTSNYSVAINTSNYGVVSNTSNHSWQSGNYGYNSSNVAYNSSNVAYNSGNRGWNSGNYSHRR